MARIREYLETRAAHAAEEAKKAEGEAKEQERLRQMGKARQARYLERKKAEQAT